MRGRHTCCVGVIDPLSTNATVLGELRGAGSVAALTTRVELWRWDPRERGAALSGAAADWSSIAKD